jgi:hypothetical protein
LIQALKQLHIDTSEHHSINHYASTAGNAGQERRAKTQQDCGVALYGVGQLRFHNVARLRQMAVVEIQARWNVAIFSTSI